jgi:hypothetical protein
MNMVYFFKTRMVVFLLLPLLLPSFASAANSAKSGKPKGDIQEWVSIGRFGTTQTVYVSPAGIKDKNFAAQILQTIVTKEGKGKIIEVWFFDDKKFTPKGVPMSDSQMLHWKARYSYNPNRKFEEFVWISVMDRKSSPPKLKETKANIRPGFAE